ncbi:MAG TPA: 30S ribosomal protein S16 [Candidatus Saccharimonadales bacterium]|nr:30S ribosomal protein S16 [Candidatus Saccharimonadales bacterium]
MQRLGRKGLPMYRIVVQDSRQSPSSGKYVALLGSYDPHTKTADIAADKAKHYLKHGAQPSDRVIRLFTAEKISLPKWVAKPTKRKRPVRNLDKFSKGQSAPASDEKKDDKPAETTADDAVEADETPEQTPSENNSAADSPPAEPADDEKKQNEAKPGGPAKD